MKSLVVMEGSFLTKMLILMVLLLATFTTLALGEGYGRGKKGTQVGFYRATCPKVEFIVQSAVRSAVKANPTIAPGILRMFFHDCFVKGCDASILINGASTEKSAGPNSLLRGFEVIDAAKSRLEATCPGVVSCADILALAARDSVVLTGGRSWQVPLGRRDGLVSRASDTASLPAFNDPISVQIKKFADKGLNTQDLVTLVGGHTIGTAACGVFSYRLYNFNNTNGPDPDINPAFLPQLRALCPNGGDGSRRVDLDTGSVDRFGNSFYENLRKGRGVIESDAKLWSDRRTQKFVQGFLGSGGQPALRFNYEFGRAMVKMGNTEVKTGRQGEIRRVCTATN
ncbi:peroxidase N1-like [Cynara cardunculus var. scolymus]|uniref:Peroxidase n=1 Tax=Cynara cardunculus var. scolymus TaxID=59895 RepID=A0A103XMJ1_CYNCS|nr:peroxidase N1-like [Cynara cardunculus var. scolymus]KVH93470.1 heme peroxidase [Cynara cardunculus var. scolymus]